MLPPHMLLYMILVEKVLWQHATPLCHAIHDFEEEGVYSSMLPPQAAP